MKKFHPTKSFLVFLLALSSIAQSQDFSALKFRFIGPDGNRTIAVAGEAGNPMVSYVGAASGGIFKTEDGGINWKPVFDEMDNSSIGALAVSMSDPKQVWAGTGETFIIRPAHANGNGVYKSVDGGKTWKNMGLKETVRISRVLIHPTNPNIVYVAALGHTGGPQQERGVFKTIDGGVTWKRILFVDENTGCSDLVLNQSNPEELFAGMWQVEMKTWNLKSGGPGSGFYKTSDGGKTWKKMENGLPGGASHSIGKTSIDLAQSNPSTVYALVEDKSPALYKSVDGGESWKMMFQSHSLAQRGPYYTRLRVSSQDENKIYTISVTIMESKDGGKTFNGHGNYNPGGDNHDIWFDPKDANRIMVAHDGCMNMTFNGGKTWRNINLPIAQMYHVAVDNAVPYNIMGNRQDGSSYHTAAISMQGSIPIGQWRQVGGCESGFAQPDPFDNSIVWSGCYDGGLDITDTKTGYSHDVRVWPETAYGWAPADVKYRWHWNFPMTLSVHERGAVYVGSQFVHKTTNKGMSWKIISPDLTTNDKSHQQSSGGINGDNLMTFDGSTLYAIAESPLQKGVLWTGSNDGIVHITKDDGLHWENISPTNIGLAKWGTISNIDASNFDPGTAYVSIHFQQLGDFKSYIFKVTEFGKKWVNIAGAIPASNSSFVHFVKEDPGQRGLLFAGTDNGLYVSPDDGKQWKLIKNNLPPAPIYHIAIQKNFRDLALATYGRGFYIMDDITPLREWSKSIQTLSTRLFPLRNAYRFNMQNAFHADGRSLVTGSNPPYGASINYYLSDTSKEVPSVYILSPEGDKIQTIKGTNIKGFNRVWWNLAHDDIKLAKLKTRPPGKDFVPLDSTGTRSIYIVDLDIGPGLEPPRVVPGIYTVVLQIGNETFKQPLNVLKDPNAHSSIDDIKAQYQFGKNLYKQINACMLFIEAMEVERANLLKENSPSALALEKKIFSLEAKLFDAQQTGSRWDGFRNPSQLIENFLALAKESQTYGADYPPTSQQREAYNLFSKKFDQIKAEYQLLIKK